MDHCEPFWCAFNTIFITRPSRVQLDVSSVPVDTTERVRSAVLRGMDACNQVHRLTSVVDIYGLLFATYSERATHFEGTVDEWVGLVRSCAPPSLLYCSASEC